MNVEDDDQPPGDDVYVEDDAQAPEDDNYLEDDDEYWNDPDLWGGGELPGAPWHICQTRNLARSLELGIGCMGTRGCLFHIHRTRAFSAFINLGVSALSASHESVCRQGL